MRTDILKLFVMAILLPVSVICASAQEASDTTSRQYVDSLVYRTVPAVDSLLLGADIFDIMPSKSRGDDADVSIHQTQMVEESLRTHVIANKTRELKGYRIRIYFDNSQNARRNSATCLNRFVSIFHGIPAYRSYANPYFKVTVGDYRTKADALDNLPAIRRVFPTAFIVKEKINYPQIGKMPMETLVDTIKVYRPKTETL